MSKMEFVVRMNERGVEHIRNADDVEVDPEKDVVVRGPDDLAGLSGSELVAIYNSLRPPRAVIRFTTSRDGQRRTFDQMVEVNEKLTVLFQKWKTPRVADAEVAPPVATGRKSKTPRAKVARGPKARPAGAQGATRATRTDSKQARLIEMLKRAKGASIAEIIEAFGWQPHTVRGAIAGALKKRLGLIVTSEKDAARGRVYRIPA